MKKKLILLFIFFAIFVVSCEKHEIITAFPKAEGFGAYTPGGRGGKVIFVTTLKDFHPEKEKIIKGSFRAACMAKEPRTVIFKVSGNISLKTQLIITEPFLTIAGQTAPGDGICIKDFDVTIRNNHDVIIRYIRFRPGDTAKQELDGFSIFRCENVIIDHCSVTWGIDENLSVTSASKNITVQWCIIAEALHNSYHHKGNHGYGSIIGGYDGITFHHNLYAHNRSRNPRPSGGSGIGAGPRIDFRNNLIYNWGNRAGYTGDTAIRLNYIANYFKPGPSSKENKYIFKNGGELNRIYAKDNYFEGHIKGSKDNKKIIYFKDEKNWVTKPFSVEKVKTETAHTAYKKIIEECGAILPVRDEVDKRIMESVKNRIGKLIDSQKEVGGWPELKSLPAPEDSDNDGMPDEWEKENGLNPNLTDNTNDKNKNGYTDLEDYLNSIK